MPNHDSKTTELNTTATSSVATNAMIGIAAGVGVSVAVGVGYYFFSKDAKTKVQDSVQNETTGVN